VFFTRDPCRPLPAPPSAARNTGGPPFGALPWWR